MPDWARMKIQDVWGSARNNLPGPVRPFLFLVALWHAANAVCYVKATGDFEGIPDKGLFHIKQQQLKKPPADYTAEAQADFVSHLPGFGAPTSNTFAGYEDPATKTSSPIQQYIYLVMSLVR
jgi:hypothetical protein